MIVIFSVYFVAGKHHKTNQGEKNLQKIFLVSCATGVGFKTADKIDY